VQQAQPIITWTLFVLGAGFLVANTKLLFEYIQFVKRRRAALLTWQPPKPPYYGMAIAIGVSLGILVVAKVLVHRQIFGEMMMFVYYACLTPLSRRIGRGFYEDGIWADSSFIPFNEIAGLTWRESEQGVTLVIISRLRNLARVLRVPIDKYSAARRLLRDKIGEHAIHFTGTGLDLGAHDERDEA
jgi:hypothetical protein